MAECIVFVGGGTGGHIYPALAVLDELTSLWQARVVWIGSGAALERRILSGKNLSYRGIPAGKLRRYLSWSNVVDVFKILLGFTASLLILVREKPKLVFSKGGYVSVPPVAAARLLGIPVFTHESDLNPGLATRINARFADRILVSFADSRNYFAERLRDKVLHTGNPVRRSLLRGDAVEGRRLVGCPPDKPLLLVLGGSLGSVFLNRVVSQALDRLTASCYVVHQTGPNYSERLSTAKRGNYFAAPFFTAELPHLLAAADLVVCRSGANTLWELAACGKPAVLIPLPRSASRGDQIDNARFFAQSGAALVLEQETLEPAALAEAVLHLLANADKLGRMARQASGLGQPEAAVAIARLIREALRSAEGRTP